MQLFGKGVTINDSLVHKNNDVSKDAIQSKSNLEDLAFKSRSVLLSIKSIYPLDLFPDTLTVDENKVNIIKTELFGTQNIHSVLIEDITNVTVSTGIFTATLEIIDSTNERYPITYTVKHLNRTKAQEARRLIQGLIACKRRGIELSDNNKKEVVKCLEELGYAKGENNNN